MTNNRERPMVAITQPYVPGYRVPLWARVIANLDDKGVECRVFYGGDAAQLAIRARRGDGVEPDWATQVRTRTLQPVPGSPKFLYRTLPPRWRKRHVLLVTEMQALNLNAWESIIAGRRYITLGHGSSETTDQNGLATKLENQLNRSAAHVLTYTEQGRRFVIDAARVQAGRVTTFRNSTDTTALQAAMSAVTTESVELFRSEHTIPATAKIALYLGALNVHKNIDLLVDAARLAFRESPDWWIVVAGDGDESWKLQQLADETGRVVLLGQATPDQYAPAASMASVLLNPGRVGLVAVDALVMGLPILTSSAGAHAPEHEYLRPGIDVFETATRPDDYAAAWLAQVQTIASPPVDVPSVESAADSISAVILAELGLNE